MTVPEAHPGRPNLAGGTDRPEAPPRRPNLAACKDAEPRRRPHGRPWAVAAPVTDDDAAATGPESALPPVGARVLAFLSILVGGVCGGLVGVGVVNVSCAGDCTTPAALGGLVGAVVGALGCAVVAVLALRAMGEWRTIEHGQAAQRDYVMQAEDGRGPRMLPRPTPGRELEGGAATPAVGPGETPPPG